MVDRSHTLEMVRTFAVPPAEVFRHLTDPALLTQWWAPAGWMTPEADVDLAVGGRYRFGMCEQGGGEMMYVRGTFREVKAPERLVYTYVWEGGGAGERWRPLGLVDHETLVTITLAPAAGGTELRLIHSLFPNAEARDQHRGGWGSNFDCLEDFLAGAPPKGPVAPG